MGNNNRATYIGLVLLQTAMWGLGNPLIKVAQRSMSPMWILAARFVLAAVLFWLFARRSIVAGFDRGSLVPCLVISLCTAVSFIVCNLSLIYTTATSAGFLMSLSLVFTPFFAWPILGERAGFGSIAATAVVTGGMYLLCGGAAGFGLGEGLALSGSALIALSVVLTAKHLKTTGPMTLAAMQTAVSALLCLTAAVFEPLPVDAAPEAFAVIVYAAVGCTCLAWSIQNYALIRLPTGLVSLLFCAEPLFTAVSSRLLLGERLSGGGLVGAALIMAGLAYAALSQGGCKAGAPAEEPV